jgi:hypothetical protein
VENFDEGRRRNGGVRGAVQASNGRRASENSITLSCVGGFGALAEMDATDAEKAQARRVQRLLYGLMIVMIGVPVVIFLVRLF